MMDNTCIFSISSHINMRFPLNCYYQQQILIISNNCEKFNKNDKTNSMQVCPSHLFRKHVDTRNLFCAHLCALVIQLRCPCKSSSYFTHEHLFLPRACSLKRLAHVVQIVLASSECICNSCSVQHAIRFVRALAVQ